MTTLLNEAFDDSTELSKLINRSNFNPGTLAKSKIFEESGISTTDAIVEYDYGVVTVLPTAPRGGVAEVHRPGRQEGVKISAVHIPTHATIYADQVQDKRLVGTGGLDSPERLRTSYLSGMRKNIEVTIESLRFGVIRGKMLDVDGSELLDLYATFGITQVTKGLDLASSTVMLLNKVIDAQRVSEDALGGETPAGYIALAAPDFMDALRANPSYANDLRYAQPSELMKDFRTGITIGDTTFIECRTTPGLPVRIPAGEAFLLPQGIANLFLTHYAPADYVETVNTPGLPIYAKSEELAFGKGYALEAQSNPINFCSRPASIIRLVVGA